MRENITSNTLTLILPKQNSTFDGYVRSTLRAHRLLTKAYLVGQQRTQLALLAALFHACFEVGEDIGDIGLLAGHAARAGVFPSEDAASEWLKGGELEEEVKRMSAEAQKKGVTGVPFAVIEGKWAVSGCQKPECYYNVRPFFSFRFRFLREQS